MKIRVLALIAAVVFSGYFLFKEEERPPAPPVKTVDPAIVKNRKEIIRFYERTIANLQNQLGESPTKISGNGYYSSADKARVQQIAEYRERIQKMKMEIGE